MGYESTLVVVEAPHPKLNGEPYNAYKGAAYCGHIATIELSKVGDSLGDIIHAAIQAEKARRKEAGWAYSFYDVNEGDTQVTTDRYGDPVAPLPLDDVIAAMQRYNLSEKHPYRRFTLALGLLETLAADIEAGRWPFGVLVLHYGH